MSRALVWRLERCQGFPRLRGDEPDFDKARRGGAVFSPLTRG